MSGRAPVLGQPAARGRLEEIAGRYGLDRSQLANQMGREGQNHRGFPLAGVAHEILDKPGTGGFRLRAQEPVSGGQKQQIIAVAVSLPGLEHGLEGLPPDGLLVVVSHGAAVRIGMLAWLGFPEELWGRFGGLSNCSWSVLEEGRIGWRLVEHNAGTLPEPVLSDDRAASDG